MVAGIDHAVHDGETRGVCGAGAGVLEVLGLAGAQLLKHVVGDGHLAGRVADAGADATEVAAAHLVDDGTQAVVTGMAAAHLNTHVAGGNIELVVDYEQFLGLDLVLAAELGDGAARGIHVRLRLDQHNLALAALFLGVVDVDERDLGAGLVFPVRDAGLTGQLVDRFEASVVAGLGIFLAWVAKSGNHANLKRLCSCHVCPPLRKKVQSTTKATTPAEGEERLQQSHFRKQLPRDSRKPRTRREGLSKRTSRSRKAARTFA